MPHEHESIVDRLDALERELERLRRRARAGWLLAGTLLLVGGAVAATAPQAGDVLRTRRLEILGDDGAVVLLAQAGERGGQLDLWSGAGSNTLRLGANEHGGDLAMWNDQGRAVFGGFATATGGEFSVYAAEEGAVATVAAGGEGARATLHDGAGARAAIAAHGETTMSLGIEERDAIRLLGSEAGGILAVRGGDGGAALEAMASQDGATLALVREGAADVELAARAGGGAVGVGAAGVPAARLHSTADGGRLEVIGATGATAATLGVETLGGALLLAAPDGSPALRAAAPAEGMASLALIDAGATQVAIEGGADGGTIELRRGAEDAALTLRGDSLQLRNRDGSEVARLATEPSDGWARFWLSDAMGRPALTLDAGNGEGPGLGLWRNGSRQFAVGAGPFGGLVNIMGPDGKPVVVLGSVMEGAGGGLSIRNADGATIVSAGVVEGGDGEVSAYDARRTVRRMLVPEVEE